MTEWTDADFAELNAGLAAADRATDQMIDDEDLRTGIRSGAIAVWCPCYGTPEPDRSWIAPDDWHADVHVLDWADENGRFEG
jgi:hypothetical protein